MVVILLHWLSVALLQSAFLWANGVFYSAVAVSVGPSVALLRQSDLFFFVRAELAATSTGTAVPVFFPRQPIKSPERSYPPLLCPHWLQKALVAGTLCTGSCAKTKPTYGERRGAGHGLWPWVFTRFCWLHFLFPSLLYVGVVYQEGCWPPSCTVYFPVFPFRKRRDLYTFFFFFPELGKVGGVTAFNPGELCILNYH